MRIECAGTAEQVRAAVANLVAQWRGDSRIYRVKPNADGSYSIWSKPHGWHQSDIPADIKLDLSHRECGEIWVIDRPDGKVHLIFRAIQTSTSVDWLRRWQVALPFVCWAVRELIASGFVPDHKEYCLPSALSSVRLEDNPEILPPMPTDAPVFLSCSIQGKKGVLHGQAWNGRMLFPSDAPTLFRHVCNFFRSQKDTAYVQPAGDGVSWHIQFYACEEEEPIKGLEYVAVLRAFFVHLEEGEKKPRIWEYDPASDTTFVKVTARIERVSDTSCLISTSGWTQASLRVLEKLDEHIKKLYPPEKYAPQSKATNKDDMAGTAEEEAGTPSLVGKPNHDIQKRQNAIRELLSKSNYMDYQLVQLLNEKYGIDTSEVTVKRDRKDLKLNKRQKKVP